mmetsp:Transcript_104171/g.277157  ORF Transcript_104171/g.277157 Transcript_104171/m.277157 type:complete len:200 (-) Transcript_104171:425-1024(-)
MVRRHPQRLRGTLALDDHHPVGRCLQYPCLCHHDGSAPRPEELDACANLRSSYHIPAFPHVPAEKAGVSHEATSYNGLVRVEHDPKGGGEGARPTVAARLRRSCVHPVRIPHHSWGCIYPVLLAHLCLDLRHQPVLLLLGHCDRQRFRASTRGRRCGHLRRLCILGVGSRACFCCLRCSGGRSRRGNRIQIHLCRLLAL